MKKSIGWMARESQGNLSAYLDDDDMSKQFLVLLLEIDFVKIESFHIFNIFLQIHSSAFVKNIINEEKKYFQ